MYIFAAPFTYLIAAFVYSIYYNFILFFFNRAKLVCVIFLELQHEQHDHQNL